LGAVAWHQTLNLRPPYYSDEGRRSVLASKGGKKEDTLSPFESQRLADRAPVAVLQSTSALSELCGPLET